MKPKLLFVINSLEGGGAERVMTTLLSHSADRRDGFDLELALLDEKPIAYPAPDWIKLHNLDSSGGLISSVRRLRALTEQTRPALTLSFLTRSNVANVVAMSGRGRPVILSERVNTSAHLGSGLKSVPARLAVRAAYPQATRIIAVSEGVREDLVRNFAVRSERVSVIHNPYDLERIEALAAEPSSWSGAADFILAMGRLVETKNFELLIRAYAASAVAPPLVIAGEGPRREALAGLISDLGLGGRVHLPGFVANPFALMRQARAYVLPSNAEGFPNGLLEAMAVGLPVVSTDCPSGPAEILGARAGAHGVPVSAPNGLITPVDDEAALAAALRMLEEPELRAGYAARARARSRDFEAAKVVGAYWRVIEDALGSA